VTTYVDSSAFLKLYVDEADSDQAQRILNADPVLATSWLTIIEVRRNLARLASGPGLHQARARWETDTDRLALVNPTERTWRAAAEIAEELGVRSLDALHLATAKQLEISQLTFCTFDLRQGQAARALGLLVIGC
jgi:predicted nucleic acid-binding protein